MILYYITIVVIVNHFLLGMLLLCAPKISSVTNKLLGGQLISFGAIHFSTLFYYYPVGDLYIHLIGIDYAIAACVGPFIYLYVLSLIKGSLPSIIKMFAHFLLAIVFFSGFLISKLANFSDLLELYNPTLSGFQYIADPIVFCQAIIYIVFAYLLYRKTLRKYGLKKKPQLKWLRIYFICTFTFIVCVIPLGIIQNGRMAGMYISLFSLGYFVVLIWQSMSTSRTFSSGSVLAESNSHENSQEFADLLAIIEQRRLFAEKEITVEWLAMQLNLKKRYVLHIFQNNNGSSFYDHINALRIKEAKLMLLDSKYNHLTIEAIGLQVGFGSRSTFYETFKKFTGTTPSGFKMQKKILSD